MSNPPTQQETPTGFVVASPWSTVDKVMYVDVKCYLSSVRASRNVLSTRNSARSINNVATDQTFVLPVTSTELPASQREFVADPGNVMTVISSNRPVHAILVRESGMLDLGQITMFVISSSIVSIKFINDQKLGDTEVNLVVV